ncbi:hypothetical protein HORIV_30480 [Vreelandella olivaria]|uniref:Response regulatory domain-containing protein n=1 Tax=Vreelandella olivaria TaxID=390919 RepID=A0ABN5X1C4_9GAMM|nr:hypothetical protein HORIV_30480 [Halomonas olivaria]
MAKVLVVDDEPNIVLSLEFLMEQAGFEVVTAEDGEQALASVNESQPDLLLLDISLPGISGFDVLERLRSEAATAQLPIIMLTAHGRDVEREKAWHWAPMITSPSPSLPSHWWKKSKHYSVRSSHDARRVAQTSAPDWPLAAAQRHQSAGRGHFAAWLDAQLAPTGVTRIALWVGSFSGGATIFLVGLVLERMLFTPLRHLQVQLARLVATPDARDEHPPEGWLKDWGPTCAGYAKAGARIAAVSPPPTQTVHAARRVFVRSWKRCCKCSKRHCYCVTTTAVLCCLIRRQKIFAGNTGLGLGKRLEALLPVASLQQVLSQLPHDGSPRELLAPCDDRWLKVILRRVPGSDGETLLTFSDATASWSSEMGVRAELAAMLTPLRQHTASLTSAADALIQLRDQNDASTSALRQRFERVIHEEGITLGDNVAKIGQLLDDMQHQGERLTPCGQTTSGRRWMSASIRSTA